MNPPSMKKRALIAILSCSTTVSYPKSDTTITGESNDTKIVLGVNVSYFTTPELYFNNGIAFTTAISVRKIQHSLLLGPVWWIDKNEDVNVFRGLMLTYKYFPHKSRKRLNFYFIYDIAYLYERKEWDTQLHFYPQIPINQVYNVTITTKWQSLINQVGYGFNLNIYKGFYITQSFGLGIEFYNYSSNTEVKEDANLSYKNLSGNIFSENGASSFLKIGIAYDFE